MYRKKLHPAVFLLVSLMVVTIAFMGCEGDQGPAGPAGLNPDSAPIITAIVAAPDSVGTGESTVLFVSAYDPNGDPMTYQWSAATGTLATPTMAVTNYSPPREIGLYQVSVTVTDNDGSATATVTVGVNTYVPAVFPSFLGDNANRCSHCHAAYVDGWSTTHHANAWETLVTSNVTNNPYCVQCHVTGYDDIVNFDGSIATHGIDNGGFDDFPSAMLHNVQCEACHSPQGPQFAGHAPDIHKALTGDACNRCHSQNEEYMESGHGHAIANAGGLEEFNVEFARSPCWDCHTNEGFIKLWDAEWATRELPEEQYQVTCATCHDVHSHDAENNPSYLRALAPFDIIYGGPDHPEGFEIPNEAMGIPSYGKGQLCGQCHHARRTESNVLGQINNGNARPGPHGSCQADMVVGYGSYEIPGYTYNRESPHQPDVVIGESTLEDMCVKCHIYVIPFGQPGGPLHGHSFAPNLQACNTCHATPADFDYHGRRTEIAALRDSLFNLLPNNGTSPNFLASNSTRVQREAGYAWYFVTNEGSMGVHNYPYARSLLINAIDYLHASGAAITSPGSNKMAAWTE